jgi:hypothetical protein
VDPRMTQAMPRESCGLGIKLRKMDSTESNRINHIGLGSTQTVSLDLNSNRFYPPFKIEPCSETPSRTRYQIA